MVTTKRSKKSTTALLLIVMKHAAFEVMRIWNRVGGVSERTSSNTNSQSSKQTIPPSLETTYAWLLISSLYSATFDLLRFSLAASTSRYMMKFCCKTKDMSWYSSFSRKQNSHFCLMYSPKLGYNFIGKVRFSNACWSRDYADYPSSCLLWKKPSFHRLFSKILANEHPNFPTKYSVFLWPDFIGIFLLNWIDCNFSSSTREFRSSKCSYSLTFDGRVSFWVDLSFPDSFSWLRSQDMQISLFD